MEREIEGAVIEILKNADMNEMTEYKVRKMAGEKLAVDLSSNPHHKKLVRSVVESFLRSKNAEEAEEAEASKPQHDEQKVVVQEEEEEEEEEEESKKSGGKEYDDDGDLIICRLSNRRRVTIQDFRGKTLVSIREYYEKDGKQLPSSKGISLTAEQWSAFSNAVPKIEEAIRKMESRLN